MTSFFQFSQAATELPGQILWHAQASNDGCLRDAVTIGRDGCEGHADDALMFAQLGDDVGVVGVGASVEDDEPFTVWSFGFANSTAWVLGHLRTYKEIWGDAPQDGGLLLLVMNGQTSKKRPVVSICGNSSGVGAI